MERADEAACAVRVFTRDAAQQQAAVAIVQDRAVRSDGVLRTDDDKYYLSRTPLKHLPLTPLQAARLNVRAGEREDPTPLLAPTQRALLARIRAQPDAGWPLAIGVEFRAAWERAQAHAHARDRVRTPGSEPEPAPERGPVREGEDD